MTLTLDFGTLYGIVERSLSVIGKRSIDDNGNLLFKDITLGSREKAIISDYFTNAFVDLCAELKQYITAEVNSIEGVTSLVYTDFWTNQAASNYTSQITRSGQNLYNYSTDTLYVSSLSFPFSVTSMSTGAVLLYNGTYYKFNGSAAVRMTADEIAALTPSTPVTVLDYMNTNPSTVTANAADRYAYYNGALYKSSRSASFSQTSIPSGAALVDQEEGYTHGAATSLRRFRLVSTGLLRSPSPCRTTGTSPCSCRSSRLSPTTAFPTPSIPGLPSPRLGSPTSMSLT